MSTVYLGIGSNIDARSNILSGIQALRETFEWRGLGFLPESALRLADAYAGIDAERTLLVQDYVADSPTTVGYHLAALEALSGTGLLDLVDVADALVRCRIHFIGGPDVDDLDAGGVLVLGAVAGAQQVGQAELYGFISVAELLFDEHTSVVIDPAEEKLKAEIRQEALEGKL